MKIELKNGKGNIYLNLIFTNEEVEKINNFFEKAGFKRGMIYNLWGEGISRECWIDTDNRFFVNYIQNFDISSNLFVLKNDLNEAFLAGDYLNLAVFRTLVNDKEISVKLNKYLTVKEFKEIIRIFKEVLEKIFNLILEESVVVELKNKTEK